MSLFFNNCLIVCEVGPSFLMVFFIELIVLTGALVKEERALHISHI